jgi:hypothetical protein
VSLGIVCDACGDTLLVESEVRYVLDVRGYAAYDPIEISKSELEARDIEGEMRALLARAAEADAEELEADVHREFTFDLCPRCWRRFRRDPLAGLRAPSAEG